LPAEPHRRWPFFETGEKFVSTAVCLTPSTIREAIAPSSAVCRLDPRTDPRWAELVRRHPRASLFHSPAWLEALSRMYGYKPFVWTTSPEGTALRNGFLFCAVESWLTGCRMVSLPFSDHCEPLIDRDEDMDALAAALEEEVREKRWRYLEIRPLEQFRLRTGLAHSTVSYNFHQIDLGPGLAALYRRFHKDSIQRKIRRAEREGLIYEEGSSEALLDAFYPLFTMTRARHNVPPQPRKWFSTLMECFGETLKIRVARKNDRAVAAMITLRHKDTLVYKYGGSDLGCNRFGGVHLLYWQSIQDAVHQGLRYFDLGRADLGQDGLVTFKNRWGASHSMLTYSRYSASEASSHCFDLPAGNWKSRAAKAMLSRTPAAALSLIGGVLYRHVG
jgi:CelD/BcsL family acetyltransferase involved in cellulose biosynthesis